MSNQSGKKILIIDASHLFEKVLSGIQVDDALLQIKTIKSADLALVELIRWHPDLLITSIEVGNINGFDLCLIVRMMPDFAGVPIVLMSSSSKKSLYRQAADAGADYYMKKDKAGFTSLTNIIDDLWGGKEDNELPQKGMQRTIKSVLLVDDSRTMRKIIKNILVGIGIENVLEAENGQEGLQQLDAQKIDMIISDWSMPIMNGVEMIKQIRLNQQYNSIPIVMVSAEVEEEIEKAMSLGINDYLRKPFNALDMKELIAKFSININSDGLA